MVRVNLNCIKERFLVLGVSVDSESGNSLEFRSKSSNRRKIVECTFEEHEVIFSPMAFRISRSLEVTSRQIEEILTACAA